MSGPYEGDSSDFHVSAITGKNTAVAAGGEVAGFGVEGESDHGYAGVHGTGAKNGVWGKTGSASDSGVYGSNSDVGYGVAGFSQGGIGVHGTGARNGVWGDTGSATDGGVYG